MNWYKLTQSDESYVGSIYNTIGHRDPFDDDDLCDDIWLWVWSSHNGLETVQLSEDIRTHDNWLGHLKINEPGNFSGRYDSCEDIVTVYESNGRVPSQLTRVLNAKFPNARILIFDWNGKFDREASSKNEIKKGSYNPLDVEANKISKKIFEWLINKANIENGSDYITIMDSNEKIDIIAWMEVKELDNENNEVNMNNVRFTSGSYTDSNNTIVINIFIPKGYSNEDLIKLRETLSYQIKNTVRHELEHVYQTEEQYEELSHLNTNRANYLLSEPEIEAHTAGLMLQAKKEKIPFETVLDRYLNATLVQTSDDVRANIKQKYLEYTKTRYPTAFNRESFSNKYLKTN